MTLLQNYVSLSHATLDEQRQNNKSLDILSQSPLIYCHRFPDILSQSPLIYCHRVL